MTRGVCPLTHRSGVALRTRTDGERLALEIGHRFPNRPLLWLPDGGHRAERPAAAFDRVMGEAE
jgi:hypothetical protein